MPFIKIKYKYETGQAKKIMTLCGFCVIKHRFICQLTTTHTKNDNDYILRSAERVIHKCLEKAWIKPCISRVSGDRLIIQKICVDLSNPFKIHRELKKWVRSSSGTFKIGCSWDKNMPEFNCVQNRQTMKIYSY